MLAESNNSHQLFPVVGKQQYCVQFSSSDPLEYFPVETRPVCDSDKALMGDLISQSQAHTQQKDITQTTQDYTSKQPPFSKSVENIQNIQKASVPTNNLINSINNASQQSLEYDQFSSTRVNPMSSIHSSKKSFKDQLNHVSKMISGIYINAKQLNNQIVQSKSLCQDIKNVLKIQQTSTINSYLHKVQNKSKNLCPLSSEKLRLYSNIHQYNSQKQVSSSFTEKSTQNKIPSSCTNCQQQISHNGSVFLNKTQKDSKQNYENNLITLKEQDKKILQLIQYLQKNIQHIKKVPTQECKIEEIQKKMRKSQQQLISSVECIIKLLKSSQLIFSGLKRQQIKQDQPQKSHQASQQTKKQVNDIAINENGNKSMYRGQKIKEFTKLSFKTQHHNTESTKQDPNNQSKIIFKRKISCKKSQQKHQISTPLKQYKQKDNNKNQFQQQQQGKIEQQYSVKNLYNLSTSSQKQQLNSTSFSKNSSSTVDVSVSQFSFQQVQHNNNNLTLSECLSSKSKDKISKTQNILHNLDLAKSQHDKQNSTKSQYDNSSKSQCKINYINTSQETKNRVNQNDTTKNKTTQQNIRNDDNIDNKINQKITKKHIDLITFRHQLKVIIQNKIKECQQSNTITKQQKKTLTVQIQKVINKLQKYYHNCYDNLLATYTTTTIGNKFTPTTSNIQNLLLNTSQYKAKRDNTIVIVENKQQPSINRQLLNITYCSNIIKDQSQHQIQYVPDESKILLQQSIKKHQNQLQNITKPIINKLQQLKQKLRGLHSEYKDTSITIHQFNKLSKQKLYLLQSTIKNLQSSKSNRESSKANRQPPKANRQSSKTNEKIIDKNQYIQFDMLIQQLITKISINYKQHQLNNQLNNQSNTNISIDKQQQNINNKQQQNIKNNNKINNKQQMLIIINKLHKLYHQLYTRLSSEKQTYIQSQIQLLGDYIISINNYISDNLQQPLNLILSYNKKILTSQQKLLPTIKHLSAQIHQQSHVISSIAHFFFQFIGCQFNSCHPLYINNNLATILSTVRQHHLSMLKNKQNSQLNELSQFNQNVETIQQANNNSHQLPQHKKQIPQQSPASSILQNQKYQSSKLTRSSIIMQQVQPLSMTQQYFSLPLQYFTHKKCQNRSLQQILKTFMLLFYNNYRIFTSISLCQNSVNMMRKLLIKQNLFSIMCNIKNNEYHNGEKIVNIKQEPLPQSQGPPSPRIHYNETQSLINQMVKSQKLARKINQQTVLRKESLQYLLKFEFAHFDRLLKIMSQP